jgi:hypothetical protein
MIKKAPAGALFRIAMSEGRRGTCVGLFAGMMLGLAKAQVIDAGFAI